MPQLFTNNARSLLTAGITSTATSITIEAGKADLFPVANVGTGTLPSTNNWFKAVLQDSSGNIEIVYVRTRASGSGVFSNVLRGQEGTTARAFTSGAVVGLRITALDYNNYFDIVSKSNVFTGTNTFSGAVTLSSATATTLNATTATIATATITTATITAATFTNTITGSISGNAATVTNGVYTTGAQTIAGVKTFSDRIVGKTAGGPFTGMWTRAAAFESFVSHLGSSYAPTVRMGYEYTGLYSGVYSMGQLATSGANPGALVIHHVNSSGVSEQIWQFSGSTGSFTAPGNVVAYSDERLKENWAEIPENFLESLAGVKFGSYTRKDSGERQVGVSAQSLQAVLPEAVSDSGEYLAVAYGNAAMVACVALAKEVMELKRKLEV